MESNEDHDTDDAILSCEEGGWGGESSDEEYADGGLPLVPRLPPRKHSKAEGHVRNPPPADEYRRWIEDVAYQVGNSAHEIRNALRYWSSLVTDSSLGEAADITKNFKQADNTSGKLEATMRALVGKVRNAHKLHKLEKPLTKGRNLLEQIKKDLSVLSGQDVAAVQEQRVAIDELVLRQDTYLKAIESAHLNDDKVFLEKSQLPLGVPIPLPAPGKRIDFAAWEGKVDKFFSHIQEAVRSQEPLKAEEVIGLARLSCNVSHELQNLSVAPRGGAGTEAQRWLKQLDGLAGKCENAARAAMVFAHRWYITESAKPVAKLVSRADFLLDASSRGMDLLTAAQQSEGAASIPAEALAISLSRLASLAKNLQNANLPTAQKERKGVAQQSSQSKKCLGCEFAVTGITPDYCCNACKKDNGKHGGRCQKIRFSDNSSESPLECPAAQKCIGCEFVVTGALPQYCCKKWKNCKGTGKHGSHCQQILFVDVSGGTNTSSADNFS